MSTVELAAAANAVKSSCLSLFEIEDDAMEPRLCKGDSVGVDLSDRTVPLTGGVFCVVLDDKSIAFRRVLRDDAGLQVVCDNSMYLKTTLEQRITIVGRVKELNARAGF